MKTYLEVADEVFKKGEVRLAEKRERKRKIQQGFAFATLAAVILISAFSITKGLFPRQIPAVLPLSSETPETATTAQGGETISTAKPAFPSTQNAAPGAQTTSPRESGTTATRAADGADDSQKQTVPKQETDEPTSIMPDESGQTELLSEPVAVGEPGGDAEPTTDSGEQASQTPDEPATETTLRSISDREQTTRRLAPAVSSRNAERVLRAALEDNAYAWVKYRDHYFVHDEWTNADALGPGERIGEANDFEGNLELLALSGDLYAIENGEEDLCLLLKTPDGQSMAFILNPAGEERE